jgi:hypothetical protein
MPSEAAATPGAFPAPGRGPTLRACLSVPYVLAVESFESASGQWLRRAFHPEIPTPDSIGEDTVEVIERAELYLFREIARRWVVGEAVPMPRPPLAVLDVEGVLRQYGLDSIVDLLDVPPDQ